MDREISSVIKIQKLIRGVLARLKLMANGKYLNFHKIVLSGHTTLIDNFSIIESFSSAPKSQEHSVISSSVFSATHKPCNDIEKLDKTKETSRHLLSNTVFECVQKPSPIIVFLFNYQINIKPNVSIESVAHHLPLARAQTLSKVQIIHQSEMTALRKPKINMCVVALKSKCNTPVCLSRSALNFHKTALKNQNSITSKPQESDSLKKSTESQAVHIASLMSKTVKNFKPVFSEETKLENSLNPNPNNNKNSNNNISDLFSQTFNMPLGQFLFKNPISIRTSSQNLQPLPKKEIKLRRANIKKLLKSPLT